nr:hypothetical protein [Streptomyces sp. SCSIO ZS0520]
MPGAGVGELELQAGAGQFGIQRQVGGTGFEDREEADDQFRGAFVADGDDVAPPHAAGAQFGGECLGALGQFAVGQAGAGALDGEGVGGAGGLGADQVVHRPLEVPVAPVGAGLGGEGGAFGSGQEVEVAEGALEVGVGVGEAVEEGGQACPVGVQDARVVQGRVGVEGEAQVGAVAAAEEGEGQIAYRADGQLVDGAGEGVEGEGVVEADDVDDDAGGGLHRVGAAQFAGQFLTAQTLMGQKFTDAFGDLLHEGGEALPGAHAQPQRQHVGEHGGGGQGGAGGARPYRHTQDEVVVGAEAAQVGGSRGEGDDGPVGAEGGGPVAEAPQRGRCAVAGGGAGGAGVGIAQAQAVGPVLALPAPVGQVAVVGVGAAVGVLLVEEVGQTRGDRLGGLGALAACGVQVGDTAPVQHLAVAVEDDVVVAQVEQGVVGGEPQQGVGEQRALQQVDGGGQVGADPVLGGGARVVLTAEVPCLQGGLGVVGDLLPGGVLGVGGKPYAQRLALGVGLADGRGEVVLVERAAQFDVAAAVVLVLLGVEVVRDPYVFLRRRQWEKPDRVVHEISPSHAWQEAHTGLRQRNMRHVKGRDGTGGRTRAHPAESKGNRRPRHTRSLPEKVSPPLPRLRADSAPLPPPRPEADTGRALPGRGNYPALSPTSPRLSLHGISYFTASVTSRCLLLQQPAPVTSNPIGRTVRAGAGFPCRGKAPREGVAGIPAGIPPPGQGWDTAARGMVSVHVSAVRRPPGGFRAASG